MQDDSETLEDYDDKTAEKTETSVAKEEAPDRGLQTVEREEQGR